MSESAHKVSCCQYVPQRVPCSNRKYEIRNQNVVLSFLIQKNQEAQHIASKEDNYSGMFGSEPMEDFSIIEPILPTEFKFLS